MNIDRLYNLSKRIIFSCVKNELLRKENAIYYDEDLFFYKDIFKKLEQIGDNVYALSKLKITSEDLNAAKAILNLLDDALIKKKGIATFKKTLSGIKIERKNVQTSNSLLKIHERSLDIFENLISIEFNKKFF